MPLRGESIGTAYIKVIADASGFPEDVRRQIEDKPGPLNDAGSVGGKEYKRGFAEEFAKGDDINKMFARTLAKLDATEEFFNSPGWKKFEDNWHTRWNGMGDDAVQDLKKSFLKKGNLDGLEGAVGNLVGDMHSKFDKIIADSEKLGSSLKKTFTDGDKQGNKFTRSMASLGRTVDKIGDGLGKVFGKGSRNNFLNFFGGAIAAMVKVLGVFPKAIGNVAEFGSAFTKSFSDGEKTASGFFSAVKDGFTSMSKDAEGASGALSALFEAGPVGFIALGAAILLLIPLLGVVASLISGITAAVIAMASAISFAIVGSLAPLVGVLGPLAAGLGGVLAIFLSISKNKEFAKQLSDIKSELSSLGDVATNAFVNHLQGGLSTVADGLKALHPLFQTVGAELGKLATAAKDSLAAPDSPFRQWLHLLEVQAPRQLHVLGVALGHFADGIAGIFIDLRGPVFRFDDWLKQIATRFDNFVNSPEGKSKIIDFLDTASASAHQVWKFLGSLGKVLGDLLFSKSGAKAGNGIFDGLTNTLDDFDQFLNDHPEGLSDFFKNGKETADNLGETARNLALIMASLDDKQSRKNLQTILGGLAALSALFANSPLVVDTIGFSEALTKIGDAAKAVGRFLGRAQGKIEDFFSSLGGARGGTALSINPTGLVKWIPGVVGRIGHFFSTIGSMAAHAATNLGQHMAEAASKMASAISSGVTRVVHFITSIPGRIGSVAGALAQAAQRWADNIFNAFVHLPSQIASLFSSLGQKIKDAIGHVDLSSLFHGSLKLPGGHSISWASGGIADHAMARIIGEAGPEAVVPLTGPLSSVDPSVRELSAIARGLRSGGSVSSLPTSPSKTINVNQQITTVATDPRAAASEMLNYLAAVVA